MTVNGQARSVDAQDRSLEPETPATEKADPNEEGHVALMTGAVTLAVEEGEEVEEGQQIGTMEAMKMESAISAPVSGTVERIAVASVTTSSPATSCSCWKSLEEEAILRAFSLARCFYLGGSLGRGCPRLPNEQQQHYARQECPRPATPPYSNSPSCPAARR
ncbi:MAG: hypothetical protein AVDCRST_MAG78-855 [uncultured Rubrobacteraceae bacterium]|uniref:Lipoyl-binding domain-containing protein n=1 Tax=uncultured Rubrobacteraceae bacterium TaxID=349277 RepID=A0A6J4PMN8_9ACTN|nr:MAG: hypothetical protein AVDCRST_MAG78-855 [uncultured Rubrobacteraceae bacterium]